MKLKFRNLGIIEEAVIDVTKPFIIFTGPNGTGKTYLSYVLSDFPREMGGFFLGLIHSDKDNNLRNIFDPSKFETESKVTGILDPEILYLLYQKAVTTIGKYILRSLNIQLKNKQAFSVELSTSLKEWKKELYDLELDCGISLQLKKSAKSYAYMVIPRGGDHPLRIKKEEEPFEMSLFFSSIFFGGAANASMFTAERTGISLFSKELAVNRLQANPNVLPPRYPSPISSELADAEDRASFRKRTSGYGDLASEIESLILKGIVQTNSDGELQIKTGGKIYGFPEASSTVKALADLVFYIRHRAFKMSRLIIDEPEIHLHPDNQLLLTRIFAKMINRGLRLTISTHSDYIIRELNNLIMLHYVGADFADKANNLGYDIADSLDAGLIQPYLFEWKSNGKVRTRAIKVAKDGFSVKSIDSAITKLNESADRIYYEMLINE